MPYIPAENRYENDRQPSAFGQILRTDFLGYRDELIISTKAGHELCAGPYVEWGSRKYILASLDQSLKWTGLDYVFDPQTPLEEIMGALDLAVRSGKALYNILDRTRNPAVS